MSVRLTVGEFVFLKPALLCCAILLSPIAAAVDEGPIVNDAVAVARALIESENPYDQMLAAGTLSDIGEPGALQLLEDYATGSDFVFQRAAIDTLMDVQHPAGIDLVYRLAAENPSFLHFVVQSLATNPRADMGEFLLGVAQTSDQPLVRQYALQGLVQMTDTDAIEEVKALIATPSTTLTTKAYGYYLLASRGHGAEVEAQILDIVVDGDLTQKEIAAIVLPLVGTDTARAALKDLSKSADARVSVAAIGSYAAMGDEESLESLVRIITHGKSMNAAVAVGAIKRMPPEMAYSVSQRLISANVRPHPGSRMIEAWRGIDWDPTEIYRWGLSHADQDVRMQTIWLIAMRDDRSYVEKLGALLKDASAPVRGMAAWAIVHLVGDLYVRGTEV